MDLPFDPEDVDFCEVVESEQTTVAVKVHFVDQTSDTFEGSAMTEDLLSYCRAKMPKAK